MNKHQSVKNLLSDPLQARYVEVDLLLNFTVVLGVLVQVVTEKFSNYEQMLLVVEVID
jgi:hypothetical protein